MFGPRDNDGADDVEASVGLSIDILEQFQVSYVRWIEAPAKEEDSVNTVAVKKAI